LPAAILKVFSPAKTRNFSSKKRGVANVTFAACSLGRNCGAALDGAGNVADADAPPANNNDTPAIPSALCKCRHFEPGLLRDMVSSAS
jgi:hypothetical protein